MRGKYFHPILVRRKIDIGIKGKTSGWRNRCHWVGISGVSTAYFLQQQGYKDVKLLDFEPEKAASFRNCGHILHGPVESIKALTELYSHEIAEKIWAHSIELCRQMEATIQRCQIPCEYQKNGYLVMAIDEAELREISQSVDILNGMGFDNELLSQSELESRGFKNVLGDDLKLVRQRPTL